MRKTASLSRKGRGDCDWLDVPELARQLDSWLFDGEAQSCTKATLANRRNFAERLRWFVQQREFAEFGRAECRAFLAYLNTAHENADGRWGNSLNTKPLRPSSAKTYHKWLRAFCNFLVAEDVLDRSPMESLAAPIVRHEQIQPFSREEVDRLLQAARRTRHPRRDESIFALLIDTGLRASELCSLRAGDVDLQTRRITLREGKGRKGRVVFFGAQTRKAVFSYLSKEPHDDGDFLFRGDRGTRAGEPLTRWGLLELFKRLGKAAGIKGTRCSPHTARHTAAISFLRGGGGTFELQQMLGHTDLEMTRRYTAIAESDLEAQHRRCSPMEYLTRGSK